jgi:hypothetical protein
MIMRLQSLLWIVRFIVIGLSPVASCSSVLVPHSKVVAAFFGSRKPFVNDTRSSRVLGTLGSIDWRKRVCLCVKAQSRCLFRLFRVLPFASRSCGPVRPSGAQHMTQHGSLLIAVFVLLVRVTVRPIGGYMAWAFAGETLGL